MQTRKGSLAESLAGTAIGFIISVAVWEFVVKPVWDIHTSFAENISITALFTVVSVIRGYVLRRFFNQLHNKNNRKQYEQIDRDHRACPRR